ncbi:phage tail assembly chaperone [Burkholderia cenocepacia]|uniref:phage tail assembly chaperone n=1 Tax=Burkholderia cenocepacia TaxID=95486 RepID=UPI00078B2D4A|nr:phage tail assembly chaperone [Burkholderia cenocepacia]AMU17241.1 phage tail protein [Burkholderia cenocepacia]AQQ21155.1 phage tail protein [Burkholderia cenocepacia]ONJ15643.1 phage tail protein [Burkholderia cenocepacia]ONN82418.1 phage tail protein [Burkholderia cenocepacia]ONN83879.1 phage tail protein [Burkholderia cenocepacia]
MTKTPTVAGALRAAILNPLVGWRHEFVPMPEWGDVTVAVREPLLADRAFWLEPLRLAAGVEPGDDEAVAREKYERVRPDEHVLASARLFVRVLYVETAAGWRREFEDADAQEIASAFGSAHERIVNKALELGNMTAGAEDDAKKASAETPISGSN